MNGPVRAAAPHPYDSMAARQALAAYVRRAYMLHAPWGKRAASARPETHLPLRPVEFQVLLSLGAGRAARLRHHAGGAEPQRRRDAPRAGNALPGAAADAARPGWWSESARRPDAERADERRRYYRLTDLGRRVASAEAERMSRLVSTARAFRPAGEGVSPERAYRRAAARVPARVPRGRGRRDDGALPAAPPRRARARPAALARLWAAHAVGRRAQRRARTPGRLARAARPVRTASRGKDKPWTRSPRTSVYAAALAAAGARLRRGRRADARRSAIGGTSRDLQRP